MDTRERFSPDLYRAEMTRQQRYREDIVRVDRQARAEPEELLASLRRAAHPDRPKEGHHGHE